MMIPNSFKKLFKILKMDGFVIFIEGRKDYGKTNFAMLLTQLSHVYNLRSNFSTNITTTCKYVSKIDNYPDLEEWLIHEKGKKLYVLDEAGKHLKKMRFMTEQNIKIFDLIQLIRHYDAGFIGVAPSARYVDSLFVEEETLDLRIKKLSRVTAFVKDYLNHDEYYLHDIFKTTIKHRSKDIAPFRMNRPREGKGENIQKRVIPSNMIRLLDATEILNLSPSTMMQYVARGLIKSETYEKVRYIPQSELNRLLHIHKVKTHEDKGRRK